MLQVRRSIWVLLGLVSFGAVALTGIPLAKNGWSEPLQDVFPAFKTVCAGHYDLDIPDTFEIRISSAGLNGFRVKSLGRMEREDLVAIINTRRLALKDGITDISGEQTHLRWARDNGDMSMLAVDVAIDIPGIVRGGYEIEAYIWKNGTAFKLDRTILDKTESEGLTALLDVAAGLREGDGPGFCFDGGRYADFLPTQGVSAFIHDPNVPGYGVTLSIYEGSRAPSDIGDPSATRSPLAKRRQVAGQPGYEVQIVTSGAIQREREEVISFMASAGHGARQDDPFVTIAVDLFKNAANADAPPYDTQISRALWDVVLTSIRKRP